MQLLIKGHEYDYVEFDYLHTTDWTINTTELRYVFTVFNTYVDTSMDYILEFAIVKVWSRADLKRLLRVISRHRNIRGVLSIRPLNDGYPKNIQVVLKGDAGDSTRYLAHILGGVEVKAVYEDGVEHWGFLFPSSEKAYSFISMVNSHGKVSHVKEGRVTIDDLIPRVMKMATLLLSPGELKAMKYAYDRGFFEVPRRIRLDGLAKELGISKATLDGYIRNAVNKIIKAMFTDEDYLA